MTNRAPTSKVIEATECPRCGASGPDVAFVTIASVGERPITLCEKCFRAAAKRVGRAPVNKQANSATKNAKPPMSPKAKPNPKPAPPSVVAQPSLKDQTEQHLTGLLEDHFSDVWDRVILKAGPEAQTGVLTFRAKLCLQGSVLRISHVMLGLSVKAGSSADGKFSHSYVLSLPEVYRDLEQGELFEEA